MTPRCSAGANSALVPCPGRSCQCVSELDLPAVGAVAREGALTDEQGGLLRCSRGTPGGATVDKKWQKRACLFLDMTGDSPVTACVTTQELIESVKFMGRCRI